MNGLIALSVVFSFGALAIALAMLSRIHGIESEHMYTLDAADELFEDHEDRIERIEHVTFPQVAVARGVVTGGSVVRE